MHIGLIGGIGPAATDFYHRGLIERHAASNIALDLTIAYANVRDMSRNMADRRPDKQAEIFARLIGRLKGAGAEAAAVTSMGGHFCIKELEAISPLPLINGLDPVNDAINQRKLRKVGIIGTRIVMASKLYGRITEAEVIAPEATSSSASSSATSTWQASATYRPAAPDLFRGRPTARPRARRGVRHAGRHRPVPGFRRPRLRLSASRLRRHPCRGDL